MTYTIKNCRKGTDDAFILEFLPQVISRRMLEACASRNTSTMDGYLKSLCGMSTVDVVREASQHICATWCGGDCRIGVDPSAYSQKGRARVESLMKLVDTGNTDVKGLGILAEALMHARYYINGIYNLYLGINSMRREGKETDGNNVL